MSVAIRLIGGVDISRDAHYEYMNDIYEWKLINVSKCQYHSFKNLAGNERNMTLAAYAWGNQKWYIYPLENSTELIIKYGNHLLNT